jgi:hypothetical protein
MMRDTRCLILLLIFSLSSGSLFAGKPQNKVDSPTLHVDGEFSEKDQELKFLKDELKNVKGLKRGYKNKGKVYNKLTEESEQLKDNFETYIGHRVEYEKAIGDYNKTIECLKGGDAIKCRPDLLKEKKKVKAKAVKRRRQEPVYDDYEFEDSLNTSMAAPVRVNQPVGFVREVDLRISQRGQELLSCYRKGKYSQQGVLKVQLKIAANGHLSHLGYEDTTEINDPRVITCLSQILYSIVYPMPPSRKVTTVRKPFVFNLM